VFIAQKWGKKLSGRSLIFRAFADFRNGDPQHDRRVTRKAYWLRLRPALNGFGDVET